MTATIQDCPDELILEIISHLLRWSEHRPLTPFQLAFTCKRFSSILQPIKEIWQIQQLQQAAVNRQLVICAVRPSSALDAEEGELNPLEELRNPNYNPRPSLDVLTEDRYPRLVEPSTGMGFRELGFIIDSLDLAQIWSLQGVLSRVRGLQRIILDFESSNIATTGQWENDGERNPKTRCYLRLLEICAEQDGVELEVRGKRWPIEISGRHWTNLAVPSVSTATGGDDRDASFLQRMLSRLSLKPKPPRPSKWARAIAEQSLRPPDEVAPPPPTSIAFDKCRVSRFDISGRGPFNNLSSFKFYFIQALLVNSSSTLTRLNLSHNELKYYEWHTFIPHWRFPRLTHFSVANAHIYASDLVPFFAAHPSLVVVNLSRHTVVGDVLLPQRLSSDPLFPNLKTITAGPEYLIPLLSGGGAHDDQPPNAKIRLNHCPKLENVHMTQENHESYGESIPIVPLDAFTTVFSLLAERAQLSGIAHIRRISLCLSSRGSAAELERWFRSFSQPRSTSGSSSNSTSTSSTSTSLYHQHRRSRQGSSSSSSSLPSPPPPTTISTLSTSLHHTKFLKISVGNPSSRDLITLPNYDTHPPAMHYLRLEDTSPPAPFPIFVGLVVDFVAAFKGLEGVGLHGLDMVDFPVGEREGQAQAQAPGQGQGQGLGEGWERAVDYLWRRCEVLQSVCVTGPRSVQGLRGFWTRPSK